MARNVICQLVVVASLGLACGSSSSTCTPNGAAPKMGDGGDCCSGSLYAGKCAPKDCWTAGEISNGSGSLSTSIDPSGGNCCASNGVTPGLSSSNVDTFYCNPIPNCVAGGTAPSSGSPDFCCSARVYSGVCTPNSGPGTPDLCVPTSRVDNTDGGTDCCAGAGAADGGPSEGNEYYCDPRTGCTPSGTAAVDPDSSDCCSGVSDVNGTCCSLTGQPQGGGTCCGGNGADGNGICRAPAACTAGNRTSVTPDGTDCCRGFASIYTGLCASTP